MCTLAEDPSVYVVVEHPGRASNCVLTIPRDDLSAHSAAITARGSRTSARRTPTACAKGLYRDPDGNELGFGRASLDAG